MKKWMIRILVTIAAIPVVAAGVLFALGQRSSAGQIHVVSEIAATPDQVWPWLTEPDRLKQWVSWMVDVKPLTPSRSSVGSREVWVMKDENNAGQRMEIMSEVGEAKAPNFLVLKLQAPEGFDGVQTYRLTDIGSGRTRLEIDSKYHFAMWLANLMEPVITPAARKKAVMDLASLTALVEKSGPDSAKR